MRVILDVKLAEFSDRFRVISNRFRIVLHSLHIVFFVLPASSSLRRYFRRRGRRRRQRRLRRRRRLDLKIAGYNIKLIKSCHVKSLFGPRAARQLPQKQPDGLVVAGRTW